MQVNPKISPVDARILDILQRDGRRSYAEIGAEIGMTGPSAHERVKKLEARGILRGYMAQVDPAAVGLGVLAFMWVTQAPGSVADDITDDFAAIPEVEACHGVAGAADYLLKIRAADTAHLERVVRHDPGHAARLPHRDRDRLLDAASSGARCPSRPAADGHPGRPLAAGPAGR